MLQALIRAMFHVRARVRLGAELFDRRRPGWADEIDVKRLNVADPSDCPLGQLYDYYRDGYEALGIGHNFAASRHGFFLSFLGWLILPLRRAEYSLLSDAWVAEVRERTLPYRHLLDAEFTTTATDTPSHSLVE